MRTVIVIETAQELIDFACVEGRSEEKSKAGPFLGHTGKLIIENNMTVVRLEGLGVYEA